VRDRGGLTADSWVGRDLGCESRQIEGGEAQMVPQDDNWYAVWTQSHCEHVVAQQLDAKGVQAFLPEVQMWSKRAGTMRLIKAPMFPGYLFVRTAMTKRTYIDMLNVRGLVRVLERGWTALTPVPETEISTLQHVVRAELPVLPHAHLHQGDRVRVTDGPLAGVEGVFVNDNQSKGRLVVSVGLLGRSVAVEVDCTSVTATR
jgi:transcriptional antiterminator NusG